MLGDAGLSWTPMAARPFGVRPGALIGFARGWRRATRQAREMLDGMNIVCAVALGGFVAAPVVAAAARRGVPTLLLNLDAVPGKANRLLARRCDTVISVCETPGRPDFAQQRIAMPLREAALASSFGDLAICRERLGLRPDLLTLVVTGASQGSQSLNDLLAALVRSYAEIFDGWQILHLCGFGREGELGAIYTAAGIPARVVPFEAKMGLAWGAADLAISRSGANSVAEIVANTVPAVLLPYPFHRDRHQHANAQPLVEAGGAVVLQDHVQPDRNLSAHFEAIRGLLTNHPQRVAFRRALATIRPPNGADEMAAIIRESIAPRGVHAAPPVRS